MMNNRIYVADYRDENNIDDILEILSECKFVIIKSNKIIINGTEFDDVECESVLTVDGVVDIDVREVVDGENVWIFNFH